MQLYTLDPLLRRIDVIDLYESLIWTERYSSSGDFELVIDSTNATRQKLSTGQQLAMNESDRIMTIESVEDKDDSDGRSLLTIKGPSLENITDERGARPSASKLVTVDSTLAWVITDTPGNVARTIFKTICVDGDFDVLDKIPFITTGNLYPADNLPESSISLAVNVDLTNSVYENIKNLCDSYNLGFRLTRNGDNSQLFFNIYSGIDRTSKQSIYPAVVFAPSLGNLSDATYLNSIESFKNTAYVVAPHGTAVVYGLGYENSAGFDRRVLMVDASDITLAAGSALNSALQQRGLAELAKNASLSAIDGEVSQNSPFKYHVDYNLGDTVEMRNADGVVSDMKVTEQIFVSDSSGDRSYPTLASDLFITPGSWFSSTGAHTWNDSTGTWDSPGT